MKFFRFGGAAFTTICLLTAGVARAERLYSVTEIPRGAFGSVFASELNDAGHALGIGIEPLGGTIGFYWSPETGTIRLGDRVTPLGINNSDAVIGTRRETPEGGVHAITWDPVSRVLRDVAGFTAASAINDAGQTLYSGPVNPAESAGTVVNADGTSRPLPVPAGATGARATALGARGDAVGGAFFEDDTSNPHAVYWPASGDARRLPDPAGVVS